MEMKLYTKGKPMKGEIRMLIDDAEMLDIANMYLNVMFKQTDHRFAEVVSFKPRKFGAKKKVYYEMLVKPIKIQAKIVEIPLDVPKKKVAG